MSAANKKRLQVLGDRAAWLRRESAELRERVLVDEEYAADYWPRIEATAGWATFILNRRTADLRRAVIGKRGRK